MIYMALSLQILISLALGLGIGSQLQARCLLYHVGACCKALYVGVLIAASNLNLHCFRTLRRQLSRFRTQAQIKVTFFLCMLTSGFEPCTKVPEWNIYFDF